MAYTTPYTWPAGGTYVVTAAKLNEQLRDNMDYAYTNIGYNGGYVISTGTAGSVSTYTFSSIPATYTHLVVRGYGLYALGAVTEVALRFNSDSANNYDDFSRTYRWNVAVSDQGAAARSNIRLTDGYSGFGTSSTDNTYFEAHIARYSGTVGYKSVWAQTVGYAAGGMGGGQWLVAGSAITSVTVLTNNGSVFWGILSLYGYNG